MNTPETPHITNSRIMSIDLARVIAAYLVMGHHFIDYLRLDVDDYCWLNYAYGSFFNPSTIFFIFAGYFACRGTTWKKALGSAGWCLAAFLLWNLVYGLCMNFELPHFWKVLRHNYGVTWYTALGFNHFLVEGWALCPEVTGYCSALPINQPLWFMRDLMLLFLLSPLISRWARYIFPTLLILGVIPRTAPYFCQQLEVVLSPYTILLFSAGGFLRSLSHETQQKALRYTCPWFIIVYLACMFGARLVLPDQISQPSAAASITGACTLYLLARWLELKVPAAIRLAKVLAPVTFFVYVSHSVIAIFLPKGGWMIMAYPVLTYALALIVFRAMKRWTPWALHLVAYYKLRPEDRKPALKGTLPSGEAVR